MALMEATSNWEQAKMLWVVNKEKLCLVITSFSWLSSHLHWMCQKPIWVWFPLTLLRIIISERSALNAKYIQIIFCMRWEGFRKPVSCNIYEGRMGSPIIHFQILLYFLLLLVFWIPKLQVYISLWNERFTLL